MKSKTLDKHWGDRMNDELKNAKTDAEKLTVLERYMGKGAAFETLFSMKGGRVGVRDLSKDPLVDAPDGTECSPN